jgi:DNA-binding response OmpR family regulator
MMPRMNGLELYRELTLKAPTLAAKVIFVTGGATTDETATFLATLPNEKLDKPFDADRLFALIDARFQDNSAVKA